MLKHIPSFPNARTLGITAVLALGAATVVLGPTAQAASSPALTANTASHLTSVPQPGALKAPATTHGNTVKPNTLPCTIFASTPIADYGSDGAGIESFAEVNCTVVVYEIEVEAVLYNDGTGQYWYSGVNTGYNTIQVDQGIQLNPLTDGDWQGCGAADVWLTSTSSPTYISTCSSETYIS
jgi:hypothetical protein